MAGTELRTHVDWLTDLVCLEEACMLGSRSFEVLVDADFAEARGARRFCTFVSCCATAGSKLVIALNSLCLAADGSTGKTDTPHPDSTHCSS